MRRALHRSWCEALIDAAGDAERISMPHRIIPMFLDAMKLCAPLAGQYLTGPISGLGSDYFSQAAGLATHTDNDYVQALPGTFLSVWVALGDVTRWNGPLVVDGEPVYCARGDAIIIDGDTPHRSCAGTGPRPVALFTYIQRGMPFRPGNTQQRAEVEL